MNSNDTITHGFNTLQNKDSYFKAQTKLYFEYLQTHIATNSMVSKATGIPQKNLTRYKREFEDAGLLFEVYKGICKHTKHRATYLTSNKALLSTKKP